MFVQVRNINPIGAVLTVLDGEAREVAKGAVVQVTPEQAGKPPYWRAVADEEVVEGHLETRVQDGATEVRELGTGLLAQVGNWEAVEAPAKEKS